MHVRLEVSNSKRPTDVSRTTRARASEHIGTSEETFRKTRSSDRRETSGGERRKGLLASDGMVNEVPHNRDDRVDWDLHPRPEVGFVRTLRS